jgi:arylsulfatase
LIVHWPRGIDAAGSLRRQVGHVIDIWPTLIELSGADDPHREDPAKTGQSLVRSFSDASTVDRTLWWSHEGNRALRQGDWKISVAGSDGSWELYHLDRDRAETNDLASQRPEKLNELRDIWQTMNDRHTERAQDR